jgi:hypothetical protein
MSQIPRPEASRGRSAVVFTPPARHGHLAGLGTFAEIGRAPLRAELERIARGPGADPVTVLAGLAAAERRGPGCPTTWPACGGAGSRRPSAAGGR